MRRSMFLTQSSPKAWLGTVAIILLFVARTVREGPEASKIEEE